MTPVATSGGKAGAEVSTKYAAQRGNQITIKFKNIMTASNKDTLCKDVTAVKDLVEVIKTTGLGQPDGPFYFYDRK